MLAKVKWLESTMDECHDDIIGLATVTEQVRTAKREELDVMAELNVWSYATVQQTQRESAPRSLGCRWVTVDRGLSNDSRYDASWWCRRRRRRARSRLVTSVQSSRRHRQKPMVDLLLADELRSETEVCCEILALFEGTPSLRDLAERVYPIA